MKKKIIDKEIFTKIINEKSKQDELHYSDASDFEDDEIDRKINRYYSENGDKKELETEAMLSQVRVMNRVIRDRKPKRFSKGIKACVSAAAVLIILVVGNQSIAAATDYNLFDEILRLGRYVIGTNFYNDNQSESKENIAIYDELRAKCKAMGYSPLLPKYFLPNTKINSIRKEDDGSILINLSSGPESVMEIEIRKYDAAHPKQNVQMAGGENPQIERKGNLLFYIVDSYSWEYGIFADSDYTYVVNASITREELIEILYSFQK